MRVFGIDITWRRPQNEVASEVVDAAASAGGELTTKSAVPALSVESVFGFIRESFSGAWQRGLIIDDRQSMTANSAVFACISRIANDTAKLQLLLKKLQSDGTWLLADKMSPFWKVLKRPNHYQNRIQFLVAWITSKLLYGNTYVLMFRDNRQMVASYYVLDPRRVTPLITPEGDVYYQCAGDLLAGIPAGVTVPASEIIHDRGVTLFHPLVGISPLHACALASTQASRIQRNSAKFFENMSRPSGMLTTAGTIDKVTAERLKEDWERNYGAENIGKLAVMGNGLKYEAMTIPAETAQLIEQLGWTVEDIARAFGVPLYKINAGPMPTNNNVDALQEQYYNDTLQMNVECIEQLHNDSLALADDMKVEVDLDGLTRMDKSKLYDALGKGIKDTLFKPNEARLRINLPPVTGGDTLYLQVQNYSIGALDRRDQAANAPDSATTHLQPPPATPPALPPAPAPTKSLEEDISDAAMIEAAVAIALAKELDDVAYG